MTKELTRKELEALYLPSADAFTRIVVPELPFFMLDGEGSPDDDPFREAMKWLFRAVHPIKLEARERMGRNSIEPPLEALWWADDMADLAAGNKDKLKWRLMITAPHWGTDEMFREAIAQVEAKRGPAPESLRLDRYHEGDCVQIMHIGPNEAERATLDRLHGEFLPAQGLVAHGPHHEIYLDDPKRTAPENRKTVLRQPVHAA